MNPFQLHPQLAADCHRLGTLDGAELLLHKDAGVPWFILVPQTDLSEFLLLPASNREALLDKAKCLSEFLLTQMQCQRTNFAAIGNLVPQLHLHIVGRHQQDSCWPQPVWGNLNTDKRYTEAQLIGLTHQLQTLLPELLPEAR